MLTIKAIHAPEEVQAYLNKEKLSHESGHAQFMGLYTADGLAGLGSISLQGTKVYLNFVHVSGEAVELQHGLAKALLNMADLRGIKTVYGSNPQLEKLYHMLRFHKENNEFALSLEGYFTAE